MTKHEIFMKRCIELAQNGAFYAAPNPMVGSIIVHNDAIIGEGYHAVCGEAHAEVNAINSVKDKSLLKEATIYVTLEPCAHFGKTPPCSDLIIEKGIPNVVIACVDSFSEVAGKGIRKLEKAGAKVIVGVLEKEARELNKRFFTYHEQKRPYIILKWAETADGFIDKLEDDKNRSGGVAITGKEVKRLVHKWRAEEAAILVGKNTILKDDPSLTVREIDGPNPMRIVLDSKAELRGAFKVLKDNKASTLILSVSNEHGSSESDDVLPYKSLIIKDMGIATILQTLYNEGITSVFVEGGAQVHQSFIDAGLWDEARIFIADKQFERGVKAPILKASASESHKIAKDTLNIYTNRV